MTEEVVVLERAGQQKDDVQGYADKGQPPPLPISQGAPEHLIR